MIFMKRSDQKPVSYLGINTFGFTFFSVASVMRRVYANRSSMCLPVQFVATNRFHMYVYNFGLNILETDE